MIRSIRSVILTLVILSLSATSSAQLFISVNFGPPALPVYSQPLVPAVGYIWTPGYWAWSPGWGYYWVPGTWVLAPSPGLLWTPGYWAYDAGLFYWHPGYWAPVVGYYGGIAYGFGYPGTGFFGGYWRDGNYFYNRTVTNVNVTTVKYVYSQPVTKVTTTTVSYNGGPGGTTVRATAEQEAAARQQKSGPTADQLKHEQAAKTDKKLLAAENKGRPPIAATAKPADFSGGGVVGASKAGAPYKAPP
ncbi:MAG: YXWGXW repeat-containing protein, partial [Terriglobales bacterium]